MIMSHMAADTLEELHQMADNIGVDRRHFQNKPGKPHYDICQQMKRKALKLGAKEVNDRELITLYKNQISNTMYAIMIPVTINVDNFDISECFMSDRSSGTLLFETKEGAENYVSKFCEGGKVIEILTEA